MNTDEGLMNTDKPQDLTEVTAMVKDSRTIIDSSVFISLSSVFQRFSGLTK
jgi:hypothetical protein